jgi:hypothetical protein
MGVLSSLAGPLIGAGASALGGFLQRKSDKASTARQMAFQERMSNTAFQRQMDDMRKAGLNPILSAKMGGASTPIGASFKSPNILGEGAKGALAGAQTSSAISTAKNLEAQARLNEQNADYFDKKSYGSAVLNAKPLNILFTELLERNPEIFDKASDMIVKALETAKDPLTIIKSIFSGEFPFSDNAKSNTLAKDKIKKMTVSHHNIKKHPIPKVHNVTPTSQRFKNYYRSDKRWWNK